MSSSGPLITSDSAYSLCRYYLDKSKAFLIVRQPDSALLYLNDAIEKLPVLDGKYPSIGYRLYSMRASAYVLGEQWDEALQGYRQSLTFVKPQSGYAGDTHLDIGTLLFFKEDYENAIQNYKQALNIFRASPENPERTIQTLICICSCYAEMDDPEAWKAYFQEAEKILQTSTLLDPNLYFTLHTELGSMLLKQKEPLNALRIFQAAGMYHTGNHPSGPDEKMILDRAFASCYQQMGEPDSSLFYLERCRIRAMENPGMKTFTLINIYRLTGDVYEQKNHSDSALVLYAKALQLMKDEKLSVFHAPVEVFRLICQKAECERLLGEKSQDMALIRQSWQDYNTAMDLADSINDFLGHKGSRLLFNEPAKSAFGGAMEAGFLLYGTSGIETLFQISERNRNKILQTMMKEKLMDGCPAIPDSMKTRKNLVLHKISAEMRRQSNPDLTDPGRDEISDPETLFALKREMDSLMNQMVKMVPADASGTPAQALSLQTLHQALGKDEAMLEYLISDSVLFLFSLTRENAVLERILLPDTFYESLSKLKSSLRTAKIEDFAGNSFEMYRFLIKPVYNLIKDKHHLVIIPDEVISLLPFECLIKDLPVEKAALSWPRNHYLVQDYEISYALSASNWLQTPDQETLHGIFGGFAPVFNDSADKYAELVYSDKEIKAVADILSRHTLKTRSTSNTDATEKAFKEQAGSLSIIHIATHSVIDDKRPENSGLIFYPYKNPVNPDLSEDGVLYHDEIVNLRLNADLVVLSACASGKGRITKTEGVLALTRAFEVAGASAILYAAWNISDRQTPVMMTEFYNQLTQGKSYAGALRAAKLKMIAQPATAIPYLWAGFMLLGR